VLQDVTSIKSKVAISIQYPDILLKSDKSLIMAMCDESGALLADSADELLESDEEVRCGCFTDPLGDLIVIYCDAVSMHLKTFEVMEFPVMRLGHEPKLTE